MTTSQLNLLLQTLEQPTASEEALKVAAHSFFQSLPEATPTQVQTALQRLIAVVESDDVYRAGYVALIIGVVLEHGYDSSAISVALIERLRQVLNDCAIFATQALTMLETRGTIAEDRAEAFDDVLDDAAEVLPHEAQAWEALELFWGPGIALFSTNVQARQAGRSLRSLTRQFAEYHEGAYWLDLILSSPIDEPLLVIEPESGLGFAARMTGVIENFQLHTLLMDAFPAKDPLAARRVSQHIVDVVQGKGPQQIDSTVVGVWNMYAWTALRPDLQLLSAHENGGSEHWIWGEGHPEDIPLFEGYRVVLLGPPSYTRSWLAQRMFAALPAEISQITMLSQNQVVAWLQKMAAVFAK